MVNKIAGMNQLVAPHRQLLKEGALEGQLPGKSFNYGVLLSDVLVFVSGTAQKRQVEDDILLDGLSVNTLTKKKAQLMGASCTLRT